MSYQIVSLGDEITYPKLQQYNHKPSFTSRSHEKSLKTESNQKKISNLIPILIIIIREIAVETH